MISDEQLVARAQAGDTAAMDAIVARYENAATWTAAQFYDHTGGRDDLCQEARLGVFKAVRDYRPGLATAFTSFAFLCIRRQLITAVKTATRARHDVLTFASRITVDDHGEESGAIDTFPDPGSDTGDILRRRAQLETLVHSISHDLSPLERESIVGLVFLDETYAAIGAPKSVDNALQRARAKLRRAIDDADAVPLGRAA